jgi:RNA polymerase sigma-70 factor (ECF subfamily)
MERKHFPAFYREHVDRIYRFLLYRVGGRKEVAEDLTQDVFVKALDAFERYDPEQSKSSWIFTIARNHLINYYEKTKPGIPLEDIEATTWNEIDMTERLMLSLNEKKLVEAIGKLPAHDADLIRWKYLEGWSYQEIAELTEKNESALRVQAHRAIKQLRTILKRF